ncbi:MAG TPA: glycoside hydrolase family 95 protein [Bacteroidota bacterium]|nr:glycoside hydrolase family 95 protein [Bacteroidota bacterium]
MKKIFLMLFVALVIQELACAQSMTTLWFNRPADYFEETLVLGNGKTGASVFGGVQSDRIYLNDATLWAGEPVDRSIKTDAATHIKEIRDALAREDYKSAEKLNKHIQGKFTESFAPLGTLGIEFDHPAGTPAHYYRGLDIGNAVATVSYDINGVLYTREYFVSYPDRVFVIHLGCSRPGALTFSVKFQSELRYHTAAGKDRTLRIDGYAPCHAEPSYRGEMPNAIVFDKNRGTRFSTYVNVNHDGGRLIASDSTLTLSDATEATIYVSIATSFNGFDKNPATQGLDNRALANNQLTSAFTKNFKTLKERHIQDYQALFNRVGFTLESGAVPDLPIDERLKRHTQGTDDKNLEVLYFQYGRYLMISSSRTNGVPANLQGIWNPYIRPPWSCNYTMNINAEENYWLVESANLSEMHMPFLSFIGNLAETGKITAKKFYGVDKGWAAGHNSDIWATSNPVGDFGTGDPVWACWNMGGTWAVTHLWEHYLFTGDMDFLRHHAYPLMKGAAEFCLAWLVKDAHGNLVTSPSTSPENMFLTPDGFKGATLYGSTADLAMIRECFNQTIRASRVLNTDAGLRDSLERAVAKLYPYQIGKKGNLQEWYYDWEDVEPQHRHQSHLFGLYPGHQITPAKTPELAKACRTTLEIKGDKTTGWSKGWRINLWARLLDGNRAYKLFRELLTYVEPDGARKTNYGGGGGTYPNLFDAHPPFQIDGNFGGSAGVIEMLLQSSEDEIDLLPALPDVWKSGSIHGICARGGFELSMKWTNGSLTRAEVRSKAGNMCRVRYKDKTLTFATQKGKTYSLNSALEIQK